ncbi:hypothetical protein P4N68_08500 [Corynebacterium felinum]|nr:hypothetical protein [Corynebacterium felinum]MDF5821116.1 hypothetical protein [Corynebacterium felinum]
MMHWSFSELEREILLNIPGVDTSVISTLERMGFASLSQLAQAGEEVILQSSAHVFGTPVWLHSPQMRRTIRWVCEQSRELALV